MEIFVCIRIGAIGCRKAFVQTNATTINANTNLHMLLRLLDDDESSTNFEDRAVAVS